MWLIYFEKQNVNVIGDGEIGVGALPALAAGGSAGGEVGGHLGRVAVEVVPDRALDVGEVRGGVIDGGGRWGGDGEVAGAVDGAGRGGDGEFAGGRARRDDRDELGGGAGVERGGDAVEFDGVGGEGGGEVGAGNGHAVAHRAAGRGEGGDGGGGRCWVDSREGDGDLVEIVPALGGLITAQA